MTSMLALRSRELLVSIRERALAASAWTGAILAVQIGGQLVQFVGLARLLEPHQVGLVAIGTLLAGLVEVFLGVGIASAIIQRRRVTSFELSSVHWLNMGISTGIGLLVIAGAAFIARAFGSADATRVVALMGVVFIVIGWTHVYRAVLEKDLNFKPVAIAEISGVLITVIGALTLAALGVGAESVAIGLLVGSLIRAGVLMVGGRRLFRLRLRFRFAETKRFINFGVLQALDAVLNYAGNNLSAIATGRFVGPSALGGYNLAYTAVVNLPAKLNPVVTRVLFPFLSTIQDDRDRMNRNYLRAVTVCGIVSIPFLTGVALAAEEFVEVAFGAKWLWISPLVVILALAGMGRALGNPIGPLLAATDNLRLGLYINIVRIIITVPLTLALTAAFDVAGAAWALVAVAVLNYGAGYYCLHRVLRTPFLQYLGATGLAFLTAVPLAAAVGLAGLLLPAELGAWWLLVIKAAVGLIALILTLVWFPHPTVALLRESAGAQLRRVLT